MKCSTFLLLIAATVSIPMSAPADTFTVTNTDDSGPGSLREAMTSAQNCTGSPHTIAFNVPTNLLTGGVAIITPASQLPNISCVGTIIDGGTQTTNQGNTNNVILGTGGTVGTGPDGRAGTGDEMVLPQLDGPEVEIDGRNLTSSTLIIQADNVHVRGLSIHGGGDGGGVAAGTGNIAIQSGVGVVIEQNVIGASASSFTAPSELAQTQSNLILTTGGGMITIQQNLMGFARWRSLLMYNPTDTVAIQQNEITASFDGIDFSSPGFGPIGAITISGNSFHDFVDNGSGSTIFGIFYTQTGGTTNITENTFAHSGFCIIADPVRPLTIRHNIMTNNVQGIRALTPSNTTMPATISENSIFANDNLGIDLNGDGVTLNDAGDSDTGPNNLQNYPLINSVTISGGNVTMTGSLNSTASITFRLEFFCSVKSDSSGFGEGEMFLGFTNVTTNTNGDATYNVTFPVSPSGRAFSATTTDLDGNTSEFSPAFLTRLLNISTRMKVLTSEKVLIGGFIIVGTGPKRVIVRGIGPSLGAQGVPGALTDTTLELHGAVSINNDDWRSDQEAEIIATGIPPSNDLESAIVANLDPGLYTAILAGKNNTTGVGLVEVYDLDQSAGSKLANISTRGFVDTGDEVMIGGFIAGPATTGETRVLIRAIGPSLINVGIQDALLDPTLELHDGSGATVVTNDDWRDTQQAEIEATGIAPTDDRESAALQTLAPGSYTAIVRGKNNTTGVALVEAYNLP